MRWLAWIAALGIAGWIAACARPLLAERYGPYARDLLLRESEISRGLDWVFEAMGFLVVAAGAARVCMLVRKRRGAVREAILYGGIGSALLLAPWILEWAALSGVAPSPWRGG